MSAGQAVVLACHAALGALEDVTPRELDAWRGGGCERAVMAVNSEPALLRVAVAGQELGISVYLVQDPETRVNVALGMGPSPDAERITNNLNVWLDHRPATGQPAVVH